MFQEWNTEINTCRDTLFTELQQANILAFMVQKAMEQDSNQLEVIAGLFRQATNAKLSFAGILLTAVIKRSPMLFHSLAQPTSITGTSGQLMIPPVFPVNEGTHRGKDLWLAIKSKCREHSPLKELPLSEDEWSTVTDLYFLFFPAQDPHQGWTQLEELWNTAGGQGIQGHLQPMLYHLWRLAPTLSTPSDQEVDNL